jgi:hypothetical protein
MSANIKEILWDGVYWIYLALDMKKWRVPMNTAIKHGGLQTGGGSSSITWATPSPPRGIVLLCICLSAPRVFKKKGTIL